jgi:hypothetical protein
MPAKRRRLFRLAAMRALVSAIAVEAGAGAFGFFLYRATLNPGWIVLAMIVGLAIALPYSLRFYRLTRDLIDASR